MKKKLDTGAQVTVARSCTNMNLRNTKQYDSNCPCSLHLSSASGNKMDIIATGHENKLVGKTYVSDVETDLISGPALQKRGYWIILPPTNNTHGIGGYILKPTKDNRATVLNIIDQDMMFDVNSTGKFNMTTDITSLQSLLNSTKNSSFHNVANISDVTMSRDLGLRTVKEKVLYLHRSGHFSKQRMLFNVEIFQDYGITRAAIEEHYPTRCVCCLKGNMQMDKRVKKLDDEDNYVCPDSKLVQHAKKSSNQDTRSLKPEHTIVGYRLGMDTKGPHHGWMLLSTREQAAGIPIVILW